MRNQGAPAWRSLICLLQSHMGEKAALLFLHGDAATEHLRFVRTAGAVLPFLRPEERAPGGVRPTDGQQVVFVVQLLALESALAVGFDVLTEFALAAI